MVVALVVTAILTTIGMSMALVAESEEAASAAYRDEVQVQAIAEAGVRIVQQMFYDPDSALVPRFGVNYSGGTVAQVETSLNSIGIYRTTRGTINSRYTGQGDRLFRGPFDTSFDRVFGGTYSPAADLYDLKFSCATVTSNCWLDTTFNTLFTTPTNWNRTTGRITEISLYAPPVVNGRMYGYATVRVTSAKFNASNRLIASETLEAVIGSDGAKPAIMADGNIAIASGSTMCGSSCERIHANGDLTLQGGGTYQGGAPVMTATGTVTTGGSTVTPGPSSNAEPIEPPAVNPWDTIYRPTTAAGLNKFYLVTDRMPLAVWTDADPANNPSDYTCQFSTCQDYGLEYDDRADTTPQNRSITARLYKWNDANKQWQLQGSPVANGGVLTIAGWSEFTYRSYGDANCSGAGDAAVFPFNRTRYPLSHIEINTSFQPPAGNAIHGTTVLVDMGLYIQSSPGGSHGATPPPLQMSFAAVGSIHIQASPNLNPALENKILYASGRDILIQSSMNNALGSSFCQSPAMVSPPAWTDEAAAVFAAHEQLIVESSARIIGIVIAENEVNFSNGPLTGNGFASPDTNTGTYAARAMSLGTATQHGYKCNMPPWPFNTKGRASILSVGEAVD